MNTTDPPMEELRRLAAELEVLEQYDARRQGWYDFGGGQRYAELSRRRRELQSLERVELVMLGSSATELDFELTADELLAAYERVGRPRLERLARESFRHGTKATERSLETWRRLRLTLAAAVEREARLSRRAS